MRLKKSEEKIINISLAIVIVTFGSILIILYVINPFLLNIESKERSL